MEAGRDGEEENEDLQDIKQKSNRKEKDDFAKNGKRLEK